VEVSNASWSVVYGCELRISWSFVGALRNLLNFSAFSTVKQLLQNLGSTRDDSTKQLMFRVVKTGTKPTSTLFHEAARWLAGTPLIHLLNS
jgi:hypothetical protein